MIRATTRPRRSAGARSAAKGIITWPPTEAQPTAIEASSNAHKLGANAGRHQGRRIDAIDADDETTPWMQVSERDDEQQPGRIADLGARDDSEVAPDPEWKAPAIRCSTGWA